ncbi:hypothetical protein [uncultured Tateyamaria sp.]|uniref:hypothetical protein n=1 Tax=Tateyamaria sp. 1078 TaxID=3417464 RepID=UPI0026295C7A|nr:hypothetical protein [uncultured Tateyamaria sp.]
MFHVVYSGVIGLQDVLGFFDQFEMDFLSAPNHHELCDARQVEDVTITPQELDAVLSLVVGIYRRNDCRKKIAFVAADGSAKVTMDAVVRRLAVDLPSVQCARFDTSAPALDFIGLPTNFAMRRALH